MLFYALKHFETSSDMASVACSNPQSSEHKLMLPRALF